MKNEKEPATVDEVRAELARAIGHEPDAKVWKFLVRVDEYPEMVVDGSADMKDLTGRYRELLKLANGGSGFDRVPKEPRVREEGPDEGLWALSQIMAADAVKDPAVVAFRERYLPDGLLDPGEVALWQAERQSASGLRWVARPVGSLSPVGPRANAWESNLALEKYAQGQSPLEGATETDRVVDFLGCLCDVLADRYGWLHSNQVAAFVLAGVTPTLHRFYAATVPRDAFLRSNFLVLMVVRPTLSPRELMNLYADVRRDWMRTWHRGKRYRPLDRRTARLAVFVSDANDGRSWPEAMRNWNDSDEGAAKPYSEVRAFARDCRDAYRRVVGDGLEWQGVTAKDTP